MIIAGYIPPFFISMATAAKFVLSIPIFLAYLVPLDVDVTGNITAKICDVGIFTVVCGSFWRVDKIQNGVTMEAEVPK
jgi:hypothetical protein